jgi:hypothetical protein
MIKYINIITCNQGKIHYPHNLYDKTNNFLKETMQFLDGGPEDGRLPPSELIADPIAFPRFL